MTDPRIEELLEQLYVREQEQAARPLTTDDAGIVELFAQIIGHRQAGR